MATRVSRIPEEIDNQIKKMAALQGRTPGAVMADAWTEYLEKHRDDFATEFEQAAQALRSGNSTQLAGMLNRGNAARAAQAAARARS